MRRVGRGIPASLAQGPSDNVGSTSFSFDAFQALGERLAYEGNAVLQHSTSLSLQLPDHDHFRRTDRRGPGCAGLGARPQRRMRGMAP
jgi:hypothetical protein